MLIDSFKGKYAFLSSFGGGEVTVFGVTFQTAEHAYQAAKSTNKGDLASMLAVKTPGAAKRLGGKFNLRPNWEEIKVDVMRQVIEAKFVPGSDLARRLLATGDAQLVEGNNWGDQFWGCTNGPQGNEPWTGANHLGILLMNRRAELAKL